MVEDGAFTYKIDNFTIFLDNFNIKGHLNRITASRVKAILQNG